jgi:hypothetical protein
MRAGRDKTAIAGQEKTRHRQEKRTGKKTRQDKTRQDKRQNKTRQDKTHKTTQDNTKLDTQNARQDKTIVRHFKTLTKQGRNGQDKTTRSQDNEGNTRTSQSKYKTRPSLDNNKTLTRRR